MYHSNVLWESWSSTIARNGTKLCGAISLNANLAFELADESNYSEEPFSRLEEET